MGLHARLAGAVLVLVLLAGCAGEPRESGETGEPEGPRVALPTPTSEGPQAYPEGSVLHLLRGDDRFSGYVGMLEQWQPGSALAVASRPTHRVTLFAPTDEAFRRADQVFLQALADDRRALLRWLYHHTVPGGALSLAELAELDEVQTLAVALPVDGDAEDLTVGGVRIVEGDVAAGSTMVHIVDDLIVPCDDPLLTDLLGRVYTSACGGGDAGP